MAPRASKRAASKAEGDAGPPAPEPAAEEKPAKRSRKQPAAAAAADDAEVKQRAAAAPPRPARRAKATAKVEPASDAESGSDTDPDAEPQPSAGDEDSDGGAEAGATADKSKKAQAKGKAGAKGGKPKAGAKAKPGAGAGAAAGAAPRDPPGPRYFLMKSEPEEFSLDDLAAKPNQTSHWEGVRNAQARNIMRSMRLGDEAFFYHSSCKVPAVVGVVRVVREAYPDHFAFDKGSKYHDPSSTPDSPKWWMVDVQLVRRTARPVTLAELRQEGARGPPIADMVLINKSRLSVQPVSEEQWTRILELEQERAAEGEGQGQGEKPGNSKKGAAEGKTGVEEETGKGKMVEAEEKEEEGKEEEVAEEEKQNGAKKKGGGGRAKKGK